MATIEVEIINPKAKKLLENLASLKLIRISEKTDYKKEFKELLAKFRSNKGTPQVQNKYKKKLKLLEKKVRLLNNISKTVFKFIEYVKNTF